MSIEHSAAQIRRDLPAAELAFDEALLASTRLFETLITARIRSGCPASTGQVALMRLAEAQRDIVQARSNLLRVHGEMLKVGKEVMTAEEPSGCPPMTGSKPMLKAVA